MKTKTYNYYSDPGHGWMKVSRKELNTLGIQDKISVFSYQRKDSVYLEEDCDMSTFIRAMKNTGVVVKFREFVAREKMSKIRSYNHFTA